MADDSTLAKGGYKQHGERSENTQKHVDGSIRAILKTWNLTDFDHVIPATIKPTKDLGSSAISHLRSISLRATLAAAQVMFLKECKDTSGAPVPLSFGHLAKIAKELLATEATARGAQKSSQEGSGRKTKPRRQSSEPLKKTATTPKLPGDLVALGKSIAPPFKLGGTPPSKNPVDDQIPKLHTKGVALIKNTVTEGSVSSKSSAYHSAFGFLENDGSPTPATKKRTAAMTLGMADDNDKQGARQTAKKARKVESVLSNPSNGNAVQVNDGALAHKLSKSLSKELFGDDNEEAAEESTALDYSSDSASAKMAELAAIMREIRSQNEEDSRPKATNSVAIYPGGAEAILTPKIPASATSTLNEKEPSFNTKIPTLAPAASKESLASLNPGEMEVAIPGLEGETMVVDTPNSKVDASSTPDLGDKATAPKPLSVAPNANMGSGQAADAIGQKATINDPSSPMEETQQSKPAVTDAVATTQGSTPSSHRLREHCGWISHGLREVLEMQKLYDFASLDQLGLAQDLQNVFETTLRHLEGDIAWVFKKHGANI